MPKSLPSESSPPAAPGEGGQGRPACPEEGGRASTKSPEMRPVEFVDAKADSERFGIVGWDVDSGTGRRLRLCPDDLPRPRPTGNSVSSSEEGKFVGGGGRSGRCGWRPSPSERSESPWFDRGGEGRE